MLVAAHPDRLWGFASVDPQVSGAADELGRAFTELGAKGLCLHPAKQGFAPDDAVAEPLTSCASAITSRWFSMPVCLGSRGAELSRSNPLVFEHTIATASKVRFS